MTNRRSAAGVVDAGEFTQYGTGLGEALPAEDPEPCPAAR